MTIRKPYENELEDVYKIMDCIPVVELPEIDCFKERVKQGKYPEIIVAVVSGVVVGVAVFSTRYDMWGNGDSYLYVLSVHPNHRRRKVGTTLLNEVKNIVRQTGAEILMFGVFKKNKVALKFYKKFDLIHAMKHSDFLQVAIPIY